MYRKLTESQGAVLGYEVSGRLTEDEVEQIQADIQGVLDQHGSVRVLMHMADMEGMEPAAVWQDLKMTPEYTKHVERLAVVGDARWQEWSTKLSDVFVDARFFEAGHRDEAWAWLREGAPGG